MAQRKVSGRSVKEGEKWVTVRIPESAHAQLERLAYDHERSVSWVARKMILAALEQPTPMEHANYERKLT